MKLQVLTVLCICLVQTCFGSENINITNEEMRKSVHDYLGDVSDRFIDDFTSAYKKFPDHSWILRTLGEGTFDSIKQIKRKQNISKVDVNSIKRFKASSKYDAEEEAQYLDDLKIYHFTLSKRLSSGIANGMANLAYALVNVNATTEHMENAVAYLYSNETVVIEDPFRNIPDPTASECPKNKQRYSDVQDKLKSMTHIKPSVFQDVAIIIEKFPCSNDDVPIFLEKFVEIIRLLRTIATVDKKPINACLIKESSTVITHWEYSWVRDGRMHYGRISRDKVFQDSMKRIELVLSSQLLDERFRGIINFQKAAVNETPIDAIQKALEYVFSDVAPLAANCSEERNEEQNYYQRFQSQYNTNEAN